MSKIAIYSIMMLHLNTKTSCILTSFTFKKNCGIVMLLVLFSACNSKPIDIEAAKSAAEKSKTILALEVQQKNQSIFSGRYNGAAKDALLNTQGVHKSLVSLIIGHAMDNEVLRELDYPVFPYLLQYSTSYYLEKEGITFRHILDQTAGVAWNEETDLELWENSYSALEYGIGKILVHSPGTVYNYSTGITHILSFILEGASNMSLRTYAHLKLLAPMGIERYRWEILTGGFYDAGGVKVWMQADDLVSIGQLVLNRGTWGQDTLISTQFIDEILNSEKKTEIDKGFPGSKHGLCWYSANYEGVDMYYAMGYGGQFLITIPELEAVIVCAQNHTTEYGEDQSTYFMDRVFPGIFNTLKSNLE